ncbi:MAG TPA: nuclear transport factor 2 family protein [Kineosporiaceae bacterium]|nr:nuclear transport factor 2 family protein [Kineosporiaceae bacterium]
MNAQALRRIVALSVVGVVTASALAVGATASASPAQLTPTPASVSVPGDRAHTEETNKRTALAFVDLLMNKKKPQKAADRYLGSTYIQHNPQIGNGKAALVAWATGFQASFPSLKIEVKRVLADGDLVMVHSHLTLFPGDRGTAVADIVRLKNGKIVEHWDVLQAVPETSANDNTMF